MDVAMLSDVELREHLKKHGISVGPIVASTRKLYEKKLQTIINEAPESTSAPPTPKSPPKKAASPKNSSKSPKSPAKIAPTEQSDSDDCEESMRYLTEEEMAADRAALVAARRNRGQGVCGRALSTSIIFVLIAVFFYFLIENAEQFKRLTEPHVASDDTL